MKISEKTVSLLKNFAGINANILLQKGKKLSTMATTKTVLAEVEIDESIPQEFGIFNLPEFLGVLNLVPEPDVAFAAKELTLKSGKTSIKYVGAERSILVFPQSNINMPVADVTFDLSAAQLAHILKAAATLSVTDIAVTGDGTKLLIKVLDKKNSSTNSYTIDPDVETDKKFTVYFKAENFKQYPDDYTVSLSSKNISKFVGKNVKVTYYIAVEKDSEWED